MVCVHVSVGVHKWVHMRRPWANVGSLLQRITTLLTDVSLSTEPRLTHIVGLAGQDTLFLNARIMAELPCSPGVHVGAGISALRTQQVVYPVSELSSLTQALQFRMLMIQGLGMKSTIRTILSLNDMIHKPLPGILLSLLPLVPQ